MQHPPRTSAHLGRIRRSGPLSGIAQPTSGAADERGASLVEYALLVALIALVCFTAVVFFGSQASHKLSSDGSAISASG